MIDNVNFYSGAFAPAAGIQILACGETIISNTGITAQGIDLLINPSSTIVAAVWCVNSFFDTASTGVFIAPSGDGAVVRTKFSNCWACSHVNNGVTIQNNSSSIIGGVEFDNCMMNQNGGSGIAAIPGSGASVAYDVNIVGGTFAGNTSEGIFFGAGITDFSVVGVQAGGYGGIAGNGMYGIGVATGSSDRYIIANNRTSFNTSGGVADGGTGGSKFVGNNV